MNSDQLDNELVNEFKKGSKIAFTAIYRQFYQRVFLLAKRILSNADEAADITADTFYKLWVKHKQFETFENIRAFLFITARNACLDYIKHQNIKAEKLREIYQLLEKEENIIIRTEIQSEILQKIKTQISNLPSREARVLQLSYFEGYKNTEIAEMLGINEKTVRNLKTLALDKIRSAISNQNFKNGLIALTAMALSAFAGLIIFC